LTISLIQRWRKELHLNVEEEEATEETEVVAITTSTTVMTEATTSTTVKTEATTDTKEEIEEEEEDITTVEEVDIITIKVIIGTLIESPSTLTLSKIQTLHFIKTIEIWIKKKIPIKRIVIKISTIEG